jgi:hypothetical protein
MNEKNRKEGFLADSVTAYRHPGDDLTGYTGVWIGRREETGLIDSDIYIDVHQDMHKQEGWAPMAARGLGLPRSNILVRGHDDHDYFTSVRWQTQLSIGYQDEWNMDWDDYKAVQRNGRALTSLSARASLQTEGSPRHGATTIWWMNLPIETKNIGYRCAVPEVSSRPRIREGLRANGRFSHHQRQLVRRSQVLPMDERTRGDPGIANVLSEHRPDQARYAIGRNLYQPLDARAAQREFHGADSSRVYLTFRIARTVAQGD